MYRGSRFRNLPVTLFVAPAGLLLATSAAVASPLDATGLTQRTSNVPVVQAVGRTDKDASGNIAQVVGKQPSHRAAASGSLFDALGLTSSKSKSNAANKSSSAKQHKTSVPAPQKSRGILSALFGVRNTTTKSSKSAGAIPLPQPEDREEDWSGVPFHDTAARRGKALPRPTNNASSSRNSDEFAPLQTKVTRGGTARSLSNAASSHSKDTGDSRDLELAEQAPSVLAEKNFAATPTRTVPALSGTSSSRRSRFSKPAPAPAWTPESKVVENKINDTALIPKVARRTIVKESPQPESPQPESPQPETPATDVASVTRQQEAELEALPEASLPPAAAKLASPTALADHSKPAEKQTPASDAADLLGNKSPKGQFVSRGTPTQVGSGLAASVPSREIASLPRIPSSSALEDESLESSQAAEQAAVAESKDFQPLPKPKRPYQVAETNQPESDKSKLGSADTTGAQRNADLSARVLSESVSQLGNSRTSGAYAVRGPETRQLKPGETSAITELPGIRVVTYGPGQIVIRQPQQYEIVVENRGAIDADGLVVRVELPDWAEAFGPNASSGSVDRVQGESADRLLWTITQLDAGKSERMFVQLKAERSGTHGLDVDWALNPQQTSTQIHVQEPKLQLTIEGPDEVTFGQSQTYRVRVLNPGDGIAPNVLFTLSPNSKTPQSQKIGDIPPGKEAQFDVDLTAQDLGELKIHGLASGELNLEAEAAKTIRVAAANLEAVFSGPELKYQNTEAVYHLQVQNNGTATSNQIEASIELPAGVQYISGIEGARVSDKQLIWTIDSLQLGNRREYDCVFKMNATGEQKFTFSCNGSAAGKAEVSLATSVEAIADLVLTISDPPAPAPIGTEVAYEIVVRNRGTKEAVDVKAIAQFSHGIEPQRVEGHTGNIVTGQAIFDAIPTIAAGDEVRLRVLAIAESDGHHRFRTEIKAGDTILVAEEATHYMKSKSDRVSRKSSDREVR